MMRPSGVIINEHVLDTMQTRQHVEHLGRWFEFIHLDDLPNRLVRQARKPFCLLTFDDGKRSNATEAAPELLRLGVPAVFYVTTDFVNSGAPLWFDKYHALCQTLGAAPAGLERTTVKRLPHQLLVERLDEACAEHGVQGDALSDDVRPMSWDDVRELARRGFSIGAHGCTHAILTNETRVAACSEIEQSLTEISRVLSRTCSTFAFPNGNYTAELIEHAVQLGVVTLMTTDPMWVGPQSNLRRLPRLQLFSDSTPGRLRLKLALAAVPGALANPDGTGRSYRRIRRAERQRVRDSSRQSQG